jgi:hypothetical protein
MAGNDQLNFSKWNTLETIAGTTEDRETVLNLKIKCCPYLTYKACIERLNKI